MSGRVIWKFPLDVADFQAVLMPKGAGFLDVQVQNGQPCMWVMCDPDAEQVNIPFLMLGTGHRMVDNEAKHVGDHLGTFQLKDGGLVFHLFEYKQ